MSTVFAAGERIGRYRLDRLLGEGANGFVFAATADDGARVAIKVLRPEQAAEAVPRSRFVRGKCSKPVWLRAKLDGGLRFTLRVGGRHLLPRGTWQLRTRATDETGRQEPARPGLNFVTLKLF